MMPYICPPFEYLYSILTKSGLAHGGLLLPKDVALGLWYFLPPCCSDHGGTPHGASRGQR